MTIASICGFPYSASTVCSRRDRAAPTALWLRAPRVSSCAQDAASAVGSHFSRSSSSARYVAPAAEEAPAEPPAAEPEVVGERVDEDYAAILVGATERRNPCDVMVVALGLRRAGRRHRRPQGRGLRRIGRGVDVVAGVDRKHGEADGVGHVDVLEGHGLGVRMSPRGGRVPPGILRSVSARDEGPIQVGHEAVVVLHIQRQDIVVGRGAFVGADVDGEFFQDLDEADLPVVGAIGQA